MVRPVDGFMSEDGQFFQTEAECEIYEARLAVTSLVMDKFKGREQQMPQGEIAHWTELILEWVYDNFDKFERYVKAKNATSVVADEPEQPLFEPVHFDDL